MVQVAQSSALKRRQLELEQALAASREEVAVMASLLKDDKKKDDRPLQFLVPPSHIANRKEAELEEARQQISTLQEMLMLQRQVRQQSSTLDE